MNVQDSDFDELRQRLEHHVQVLAGDIGERNIFKPDAYARAADYISGVFGESGYEVDVQSYTTSAVLWSNLIVTRRGNRPPRQIIVVGAHYDSVMGCPGANDNASGVAVLLELAREFAGQEMPCTLRFVAFGNEEPPFFLTDGMGSRLYAQSCRARGEDIAAMISLETLGCFSDKPGSQKYPPLFKYFYPERGNFIAFVSNFASRSLLSPASQAFRSGSNVPVETVATFASIPGVSWSDHGSFWHEGYRAFMVTDTAPYRYPHYHRSSDTPDKLCYEKLAQVAAGMKAVVGELAL